MSTTVARADWRTPTAVLVCGGLILTLGLGIRHGFGLFLYPMTSDLHWSRETFALAFAVQNLVWGLGQPFAGMIADRYGAGRVVASGALMYVLGLMLMAHPGAPWQFILSAGVLIGLGLTGVTFSMINGVLGRAYPPEKRSMVFGIAGAAGSFGQFALLPLTQTLLTHVRRLHEQNPMLGLRGVRLGIQIPGLFRMQARSIAEAAADRMAAHGTPRPEIMVPLVASVRELEIVRAEIDQQIAEVEEERGVKLDIAIGTMIELPRAAFLANRIAKSADFFSFGTNDLTQMAWGFSRDDVEASFFSRYFEHGIFDVSPFESLDQLGVGGMVEMGTKKGRKTKPDLKVGVCGEHGGDPRSVHFFDRIGLDYVSCSPFRVPVARLEAGRSVLEKR